MPVLSVTLSTGLAGVFVVSGVPKLLGTTSAVAQAEHLGVPVLAYRSIGAAEVLGAAGLLAGFAWAPLGVTASVALAALMTGAVATHLRAHDRARALLPAAVLGLVASANAGVRLIRV